jgi:hypothetical protein
MKDDIPLPPSDASSIQMTRQREDRKDYSVSRVFGEE